MQDTVGATLPSSVLRTVSLCFGNAQHDELAESSNRVVARGAKGGKSFVVRPFQGRQNKCRGKVPSPWVLAHGYIAEIKM